MPTTPPPAGSPTTIPLSDQHVFEALEGAADGHVAEGCVGAGTADLLVQGIPTSPRELGFDHRSTGLRRYLELA